MITPYELVGLTANPVFGGQDASHSNVWRYSCDLSSRNIHPTILTHVVAGYPVENYEQWLGSLSRTDDRLGRTALWIKNTIHQMPAGIDLARDVDGGGFTRDEVEATLFTRWVALEDGTHVRFSEARTAMHNDKFTTKGYASGGALRTPVMSGLVLEATSDTESRDPRDAVSLAIYEFAREEDARYPWAKPRLGRLFDLTEYNESPFFAGPLYNGHPNEVTDPKSIEKAIDAAIITLRLTVESNLTTN